MIQADPGRLKADTQIKWHGTRQGSPNPGYGLREAREVARIEASSLIAVDVLDPAPRQTEGEYV